LKEIQFGQIINLFFMNKNSGFSQTVAIIVTLVIVVCAGIVWAVAQNNQSPDNAVMDEKMEDKIESNESNAMMDGDQMENDSIPTEDSMIADEKMDDSDVMMTKPGAYKDYSVATVESEQQAGNKVVLFFHASWCPFCKAANQAFTSRASEIPSGVTILKTDYDSNTELKQKYGVSYQHTFVQIDSDENQVSKWNGGDIDNLKKYLK